jgi:hypothetical protein
VLVGGRERRKRIKYNYVFVLSVYLQVLSNYSQMSGRSVKLIDD